MRDLDEIIADERESLDRAINEHHRRSAESNRHVAEILAAYSREIAELKRETVRRRRRTANKPGIKYQ